MTARITTTFELKSLLTDRMRIVLRIEDEHMPCPEEDGYIELTREETVNLINRLTELLHNFDRRKRKR